MNTQHIGAAGELLVQYRLLKLGVDSARLTTDAGVDLVVYSLTAGHASTVQVKTVLAPAPAGGRGRLAVGWSFPHELGADFLAVVLLSDDEVWLFTADQARLVAQQHTSSGSRRLYWYTDVDMPQRHGIPLKQGDMTRYLLEERVAEFFLR